PDQRPLRLRAAQGGKGGAPAGAHLAVRRAIPTAHLRRLGVRLPRGRRGHRDRDPGRGLAGGHVPCVGERRPARQQDVVGGADHAPPDWHRGLVSAGAQAAPEQGHGAEDAEGAAVRAGGRGAGGEESGGGQAEDGYRVRQPDPVLRVPALHDGQRPPHRPEGERRPQGDGRRSRPLHRGVPQALREQGRVTSFVEEARREKLKELRKRGVEPFGYRFERTSLARSALDGFREDDKAVHRLAGRLVLLRPMGKVTFGHLEDASGRIQLYFKRDFLGDDTYGVLKLLDLGDLVGVEGPLFRTQTGEVTLQVRGLTVLAKSLRPLSLGKEDASGVRHGELSDPELRARQRYADLAVHPEVREVFKLRARVVSFIRKFLDARGYLEVETPVLQPLYGGAAARPFKTHYEALDTTVYLRIADELYLKRCIVGGVERVYEIGHDFRNEGLSRFHNPEFTMAEWYEAYADYHDMLELTEEMVAGLVRELFGTTTLERHGATLDFTRPFARKDFSELVRATAGVDLGRASEGQLRAALE